MREVLELILLRVSQSTDIDQGELALASRLIIDSVCEGLKISRAGIWLYDNTQSKINCKLLIDKGNDLDSESLALSRDDFPNYFKALNKERSIAANDARTDPATAEFADVYLSPLNIASMLDVPIRHRGKMIGIICCEHQGKPRQWHADEIVFAGSLADLYGRAVSANERADYQAQLLEANQTLENKVKARTAELEATLLTLEQAQEKLVESEKMAALGKLVAGVAHEVNTPLGVSVTAVTHCEHRLKKLNQSFTDGSISRKHLQTFIDNTFEAYQLLSSNLERAATLIQNFKKTAVDQSSFELVKCQLNNY